MAGQVRAVDYISGTAASGADGADARPLPARAQARTTPLDEPLQLLARAVQQFHTYPPSSPICASAVEACQRAIATLPRDQFSFRVSPTDLIVDETPTGRGTIVEVELARRLHAASIAQVAIEQDVSLRELTHFCCDLIATSCRGGAETGFIELLAEHGVDRVALRPAYRPEVLPVSPPPAPVADLIAKQRQIREQTLAAGGPVDHLYPPDKGWVRLDPSVPFPSVSLIDLALLADDPGSLATMLVRLTDEEVPGGGEGGEGALAAKFSDVTTLFNALDPRVARIMFAKLARAVLELDTTTRQALLRRTILPGLLDGRIDGSVLRDFPDVELAESLCLLLDLETAAPEVVTAALSRLDLSAERQAAILPLIEARLEERRGERPHEQGLDAHARKLVQIERHGGRDFAEFSAFDLALDPPTVQTLAQICQTVGATDLLDLQLRCLNNLARLQPNPELVERFVERSAGLASELERLARWVDLGRWLAQFRLLARHLRDTRPDVADVIERRLNGLCTPERARRLVSLAEQSPEMRAVAGTILQALGPAMGSGLLAVLGEKREDAAAARGRAIVQLLCEHAALVAPSLAGALPEADAPLQRIIARVLGLAGRGYEPTLGTLLDSPDEQTVREALRSLAKIGTAQAASIVGGQIRKQRNGMAAAAEQTLCHFPPAEAQREIRQLLGSREFMLRQPEIAARLLDRAAQTNPVGLESILQSTAPLQYRFWNPPVRRLGRKARALLNR
ncbi:MAG TPA: hypothetical protein VD833_07200 [Vicinamibacterales bacterium]|nr:hypothetical protein [Vicinamibacterales bacterium]